MYAIKAVFEGLGNPANWKKVDTLGQDADFRWREGDERVGKYLKGLVIQRF
jgi:hypothetical protein